MAEPAEDESESAAIPFATVTDARTHYLIRIREALGTETWVQPTSYQGVFLDAAPEQFPFRGHFPWGAVSFYCPSLRDEATGFAKFLPSALACLRDLWLRYQVLLEADIELGNLSPDTYTDLTERVTTLSGNARGALRDVLPAFGRFWARQVEVDERSLTLEETAKDALREACDDLDRTLPRDKTGVAITKDVDALGWRAAWLRDAASELRRDVGKIGLALGKRFAVLAERRRFVTSVIENCFQVVSTDLTSRTNRAIQRLTFVMLVFTVLNVLVVAVGPDTLASLRKLVAEWWQTTTSLAR